MPKSSFKLEFSKRLRELMIQHGHSSSHSDTGVSPSALIKAINTSSEMALRYLNGISIPNPECIIKMATWLKVEPGYLLFGGQEVIKPNYDNKLIKIDADVLKYALLKFAPILKDGYDESDFLDFFISILSDLSQMHIAPCELKKVFDLAIKSSTFDKKPGFTGNSDHENSRSKNIIRKITS